MKKTVEKLIKEKDAAVDERDEAKEERSEMKVRTNTRDRDETGASPRKRNSKNISQKD